MKAPSLKINLHKITALILLIVSVFMSVSGTALALSQEDLDAIYNDTVWYRGGDGTGTPVSNFCLGGPGGSGPLYGPFFPKIPDTAALAQAIRDYITNTRSDSPLVDLADAFVAFGLQYDVNPVMVLAMAQKETSLATAGYGRSPKFNIGNIRGDDGGDGTGFRSYGSLQEGLEAMYKNLRTDLYLDPPSNFTTVSQVINRWAPPVENDTTGYIEFVGDVMKKVFSSLSNIPPDVTVDNCTSSNDPGLRGPPQGADESKTPCDPRTDDIGPYQGYQGGNPVQIRLCALPNLPCPTSAECNGGYNVNGANGRALVNAAVSTNFYELVNAARSSLRRDLWLTANSSYRTMEHQQALWNANPDPAAVARPGYSNHQMGLAIDFDIKGISETRSACIWRDGVCTASGYDDWEWLNSNARRFGLYQYSGEFWHFSPTAN